MEKKKENKNLEVFSNAPVPQAVLKNVLPAMAAMIMVLIYNRADTFFIGQTHDDILIAAVSLAMPVFLLFTAVGTIFGVGGVSVISWALGEGRARPCSIRLSNGSTREKHMNQRKRRDNKLPYS